MNDNYRGLPRLEELVQAADYMVVERTTIIKKNYNQRFKRIEVNKKIPQKIWAFGQEWIMNGLDSVFYFPSNKKTFEFFCDCEKTHCGFIVEALGFLQKWGTQCPHSGRNLEKIKPYLDFIS